MKLLFAFIGLLGLQAFYLNYKVNDYKRITNDRINRIEDKMLDIQRILLRIQ